MTDRIDTNKAQLQALGEHQPLCLAAENEALKRQIAVMAELILCCRPYVLDEADWGRSYEKGLIKRIDDALAGKLPDHIAGVSNMVPEGWIAIQSSKVCAALEAVQDALEDAYGNAMPVCCGRGNGIECCGNPAPDWSPEDQRVMDVLSPIQRELSAMLVTASQAGGGPCAIVTPSSKSD